MRSNRTRIAIAAVTLTASMVAGAAPAAAIAAPIAPYKPIATLAPIEPLAPTPRASPLVNPDRQDFTSPAKSAEPDIVRDSYTVTVPPPPAPKPTAAPKPADKVAPKPKAAAPAVPAVHAAPTAATAAAPAPVTWDTSPGSAQSYAASKLSSYGWGQDQMSCLVPLWNKESTWNYQASNPGSGAYGIPQSLPGSKMASAGADWQTNPQTQINWGLGYIKGSYGSPCGAWGHSQATGWY
jgi:hypothetical protein